MIQAKRLTFGYPNHPVLEDASFTIPNGAKVGLVGPNGAGKTTLLKILGGQESADGGTIELVGSMGLVPQEVRYDPLLEASPTIRHYIDPDPKRRDDELRELLDGMELRQLTLGQAPRNLSGGQKTKLAFLRNIILEPDILLLDEPTNFLDVPGKRWVMRFLATYPKTLLVISHDIALLNEQLTKVLAVNTFTKKVDEYAGNYSQFLKLRQEREALLKRELATKQKRIQSMEQGLRQTKGRSSKKGVRARIVMQRRIERAKQNLPELPPEMRTMKFQLPDPSNVGRIALDVRNISKSFGTRAVLTNVSFMVERGQKIALIGRNGAGKSTLLKTITGQLTPDRGEIKQHEWLDIGYYAQEHESFNLDSTLLDAVIEQKPDYTDSQARALLGRFMFPGDRAQQYIGTLSGGEKTRLAIALLTIQGHNLLILDEPTTYLDLVSQRIILEVLKDYRGAMILVSHTEDFVRELEPDRGLILPDNTFDFWRPEMLDIVAEQ